MKIPSSRSRWSVRCLIAIVSFAPGCTHRVGRESGDPPQWLGTWEAAPQLTEPRNLPPAPGLAGSTLRQRIHISVGGSQWRIRLSNEFSDEPLLVRSAHLARALGGDTIDVTDDVSLPFQGDTSVAIAPRSAVVSDPVHLAAAPLSDLAVSLAIGSAPSGVTGHPGSRTTSYLASGSHVSSASIAGSTAVEHWYIVSGAEVLAPARSAAVVVLGNSIADGRGSGTNKNNRWPDLLARRLQLSVAGAPIAVLNAGIGGNAVVRGGLGPTALDRLDRDVLAQAGARWLIVSDGVNDIGNARGAEASALVARELIEAYREIIRRARARRLRVYGGTITPFGGSFYASLEHEAARQTVNAWIRESGEFDAVIDFDAALRDTGDPTRLLSTADSGDHLHPNERGYELMAAAIDLSLFVSASR